MSQIDDPKRQEFHAVIEALMKVEDRKVWNEIIRWMAAGLDDSQESRDAISLLRCAREWACNAEFRREVAERVYHQIHANHAAGRS